MTREQQIGLMKECLADAAEVLKPYKANYAFREKTTLAAAFFDYRARRRDATDIPCSSTDKAPDVEKD